MGVYYIGAFPIEGGGVTIKNRDLFIALKEKGVQIKAIDLNKITRGRNLWELVRLLVVLVCPWNRFVVGISTGRSTRRRFSKALSVVNRRAMHRSIIMVMGGTDAHNIAVDADYRHCMSFYKRIYVETPKMLEELRNSGLTNGDYYPNGRFRSDEEYKVNDNCTGRLKCVFFSYIRKEKGADILLEAAKRLPNVDFAFYGSVYDEYAAEFEREVSVVKNAEYKGNFQGTPKQVYRELNGYDVLLLPTRYKTEGVPGILVEAKIGAITSIVSDESHNSEIVDNGVDGIVLQDNTVDDLCDSILSLDRNRKLLYELKSQSQHSAENYYIENYIDGLAKNLLE